ncbi:MAG: O-antigen ligase family protein [Deltaproteobacteria bacterium]|nr:O-antigen ligase family protein [Deltaproteobacteria bacterium]
MRVSTVGVFLYFLILAYGSFSLLWAYDPLNTLVQLVEWVSMGVVFFYIPILLKNEETTDQMLRFLFLALFILEGMRLAGMVVEYVKAQDYVRIRYSGFLSSMGFLLFTAALFSGVEWKPKWLLYVCGFFFGTMVVISLTRTIWIGTVLAVMLQLAAFASLRNIMRVLLITAAIVSLITVLCRVSPLFKEKFLGRKIPLLTAKINSQLKGIGGRYAAYRTMVDVIKDHPLGIGFGGYQRMFHDRYEKIFLSYHPGRSPVGAHSGLVYHLVEFGMLGFLPLFFLLFRPLRLVGLARRFLMNRAMSWCVVWGIGLWVVSVCKYFLEASNFERRFSMFFTLALAEFIFCTWQKHDPDAIAKKTT